MQNRQAKSEGQDFADILKAKESHSLIADLTKGFATSIEIFAAYIVNLDTGSLENRDYEYLEHLLQSVAYPDMYHATYGSAAKAVGVVNSVKAMRRKISSSAF